MLMWKRWKKGLLGAVAGLMVLGAGVASAEMAWISDAKVTTTLSEAGSYGDCMIYVNKPISDSLSGCPSWVTFSCDGTYNSKDAGQRKFESAQLALALGYRVQLFVDNTKKHNGYCYAQRIDIYK
ncbi:MAG TPA: hypothetical protein ENI94_14330 [Gammaproteobacteria bacterium]|nr:hypothetical protein [Gammaproteobacteria bacterium]